MQKITPFLWLNNQAEEAAKTYTAIFKNSKIVTTTYYSEGSPAPKGTVMTVVFEIEGQEFIALNGGTHYKITPGISFVIHCDTQAEIDYYWDSLASEAGPNQCGWLTDKFGVTWQVVPTDIASIAKSPKAMQALMTMTKLDVGVLRAARDSEQ